MAGEERPLNDTSACEDELEQSREFLETLLKQCQASRMPGDEPMIQMVKDALADLGPPRPEQS